VWNRAAYTASLSCTGDAIVTSAGAGTARHRVATPANWKPGDDVMINSTVSDDEARLIFGEWKALKPYIRIVPEPA
jgi:hydrogenase maturation factor